MCACKILAGADNFAKLRLENCYYVDKTDFLLDFLSNRSAEVTLITRPRRFGKTLLMSMLSEFFDIRKKGNYKLFAGLKISANEELCREWMNQHPVLFLSLKGVENPTYARTLTRLQQVIADLCRLHRYLLTSEKVEPEDKEALQKYLKQEANEDELAHSLAVLSSALASHRGKPVIVLIDEYDVPAAYAADNGFHDEMIGFMRNFLGDVLKGNPVLNFAVLTGCLRITREDIFTGLNNLKCYGISDNKYVDSFGFTQAEVDTLLADAGLSSRREEIKSWYDGYCFGDNQEIYCPWSILNYVLDLQEKVVTSPKPYWLHSSANALVVQFLKETTLRANDEVAQLLAHEAIVKSINTSPTYNELKSSADNFWSLLYMTGYLTRVSEERLQELSLPLNPYMDEMALVIPNEEIRKVFAKEVITWFRDSVTVTEREALTAALWQADADRLARKLEEILEQHVSCRDLAGAGSGHTVYENYYHGLLTGYFLASYAKTYSNLEAGHGYYDIQVTDTANGRGCIMEIKRAASETDDLALLAEQGLRQIAEKKYDARLLATPGISTVLHWSFAFCKKSCQARALVVKQGPQSAATT